jgi:hypothetical protein
MAAASVFVGVAPVLVGIMWFICFNRWSRFNRWSQSPPTSRSTVSHFLPLSTTSYA